MLQLLVLVEKIPHVLCGPVLAAELINTGKGSMKMFHLLDRKT